MRENLQDAVTIEETGGTGYLQEKSQEVLEEHSSVWFCVVAVGPPPPPRTRVEAGLMISLVRGDPVTMLRLLRGTQVYLVT